MTLVNATIAAVHFRYFPRPYGVIVSPVLDRNLKTDRSITVKHYVTSKVDLHVTCQPCIRNRI